MTDEELKAHARAVAAAAPPVSEARVERLRWLFAPATSAQPAAAVKSAPERRAAA